MINRRKEAAQGFLYILPSLVLILVFSVVPILMSLYFSFTKYNVLQPPQWTGLDNYIRLFRDPYVRASLKNTVVFTVITVPLQTAGSLVLAAVIAELFHNKFGNFVKSSLFVPVIASAILVGTLWFTLLSPRGVVNSIIHAFGLPSVNWLGGKLTSMLSVCIVSVWKNVGYFLVIYFAGIMDIPRSLYEAAEVDGQCVPALFQDHAAGAFQRDVPCGDAGDHLVVPGVRPGVHHDGRRPGHLHRDAGAHNLQRGVQRVQYGLRKRRGHADVRVRARRFRPAEAAAEGR